MNQIYKQNTELYNLNKDFSLNNSSGNLNKADIYRIKKILSLLPKGNFSILDLGSNNGELTNIISKRYNQVVGLEFIKENVSSARKKFPNIKFIEGDITNLRIKQKFDIIIAGEIIEHVLSPINSLKKIKKIIKKQGILIISVPNIVSLQKRIKSLLGIIPDNSDDHLHLFTKKKLIDTCKRAGFDVKEVTSTKKTYLFRFLIPMPLDSLSNTLIIKLINP